jgi:uracil-DNA glycosylase family 4
VLERAIRRSGYSREQFVVYNTVPAQPPRNWLEGAPYEAEAIAWGRPFVEEVIRKFRPRCILALGGVALKAATGVCGEYRGISHLRGWVLPSRHGIPVVGSFHPAFLRRGEMAHFGVLMHDLKLAVAVAGGRPTRFFSPVLWRDFEYTPFEPRPIEEPAVPPGYQTHPSEQAAWDWLRGLEGHPDALLAYDIETPRSTEADEEDSDELADTQILSIQFSHAVGTGIFLPWREGYVDVARAALALGNVKAGANTWRFDDPLLKAHGCRLNGVRHDVRWTWGHLQPDLKKSLQFISSFYQTKDFCQPWKALHLSHPEVYGIKDVDAIQYILCG